MIRALILGLCTSAVWFLAASTAARAHHSFAATFEAETVSELEGEVMSVAWRNPHVLFTLRATGADGQEVLYQIESHSLLLRLEEYDTVRTIHMNETAAPADYPSSDLGYSTGRWEGNTLVVRTTNISWRFFDSVGIPLSEAVEIEERFTPSDDGSELDLVMTVTDPATFTAPVEVGKTWLAISGVRVEPYDCIN
ncbi:MAG: DUF6152 family protein [Gammaproteobacteria bacterium]|nr:DUF6152 family protein [Gammaproteobacteria bacterium]